MDFEIKKKYNNIILITFLCIVSFTHMKIPFLGLNLNLHDSKFETEKEKK